MKLSEKIQNKKFPELKGVLGKNVGYQIEHVELFLEEIATEVEKLEKENSMLAERLRMIEEDRELRGDDAPRMVESDDMKKRMKQLETLERSYKRMIYIAEQEAESIREEAKEEAKRLIGEAQNKAQALMKEANIRFDEKQKEIQTLLVKEEEIDKRLKNIADFILNKKTNGNVAN